MAILASALSLDGELARGLLSRAPPWIMGLLIVLFGIRAALLLVDLAGAPLPQIDVTPPPPAATRAVVDLPAILRAYLFGRGAPPSQADAPITSMQLKLTGVVADIDEQRGFAMIGTSTSDQRLYRVGEAIPGGARLHAVYVDRVLLDRSGAIEALPLPVRAPRTSTPPAPVASIAPVERVQQMIRDNPGLLGEVIQRQAVFQDGALRGMRVYPGTNALAFERLGLKANDIVTAINGTRLDDAARAAEVFGILGNSAEARVTVLRNGQEQDLSLDLAGVAAEAEQLAASQPPPGPDAAR